MQIHCKWPFAITIQVIHVHTWYIRSESEPFGDHPCYVCIITTVTPEIILLPVADPGGGGGGRGGGGGGAEGAYAPPNKPTQNMNLIIVEQIAMR